MDNEKALNEDKIEGVTGGRYLSVEEFEKLEPEEQKKLLKSAKLSDDVLGSINGGTLEETKELLDWCNRHGAGITRKADDPDIDASIIWFLITKYPEFEIMGSYISETDIPNHISGKPHKEYMELLRRKYGD